MQPRDLYSIERLPRLTLSTLASLIDRKERPTIITCYDCQSLNQPVFLAAGMGIARCHPCHVIQNLRHPGLL